MSTSIRRRTWEILEVAAPDDRASRLVDLSIMSLIIANVVMMIIETVESIHAAAPALFTWFEVVSVTVFSAEYLLRLWSCPTDLRYRAPVRGRIRFALSAMAVIDLLAVLPFYLTFLNFDLRFLRALRLFRLFRLAKLTRYLGVLQLFGRVARESREQLVTSLLFLGFLLLCSSSLMYFAEREAQPQAFGSIPAAAWWAVTTLTTVGYGDVTPVTALGRLLAAAIAILGIGLFAIPAGIISAGFVGELEERKRARRRDVADTRSRKQQASDTGSVCPTCGRPVAPAGATPAPPA
jgi:voltage-gated potassium channel